jgi:hypothetical protein
VNGLRQYTGGKPLHVQIFHRDQSKTVDQLAGFLVKEVGTLVDDVSVGPLEQLHRLATAIALLVGTPRHFALASPQPGLCLPVVAGILNLGSIGQNREAVQANIDSNLLSRTWQRFGGAFDAETNEPAPSLPLDRGSLDRAFDGPVQLDLDVSSPMHANLSVGEQAASCRVLRERQAVVAPERTEAGKPDFLIAALHASEECRKGFIHTAKNILSALGIYQRQAAILPHRGQLVLLIEIADRLSANLPYADSLFKRCVVEARRFAQLAAEKFNLRLRGVDAVLEG